MTIAWKIGDLGRFENESPKQPRFEVVGVSSDKHALVWYGGDSKVTRIPADVFKSQCVKWWVTDLNPTLHPWIIPGAKFYISAPAGSYIRQAIVVNEVQISNKRPQVENISTVDIRNCEIQIRSIRMDYASCMNLGTKILVMMPLKTIHQHGTHIRTVWDRLRAEEDFFKPSAESELERIMQEINVG